MHKRTFISLLIVSFIICAVLALLGYMAFMYQNAYTDADAQLQRAKIALTRNFMIYGTLVSANPGDHTLQISAGDPYRSGGDTTYRLAVLPDAFIGWQETTTPDNGVTAVSSTTPLSTEALWALPAGTKMKFLITLQSNGSGIAFLLAGNPL